MTNSSDTNAIIVFITAPNESDATVIARALVEARLAACVNIVNNVRSIFTWEGNIEDDSEVLMTVKTRRVLFNSLTDKVKELHPYDVPEIIALPIVDGSEDYIRWIEDSTL